ncbi:hypothetical protein D3C72_1700740 [compost metagenome]
MSTSALTGCFAGVGAGPGALPAVVSMLELTAYPGARFLAQETDSQNVGFVQRPGKYGSRVYETTDTPKAVRDHYERFAKSGGWKIVSQSENWEDPSYGHFLAFQKAEFYVSVQPDYSGGGYDPGPIDATPTVDPGAGNWGTPGASPSPSPSPSAAPWPSPSATPSPSPSAPPKAFRFRVNVNMQ